MQATSAATEAFVELAKKLYFEFRTVAYIEAQTGIPAKRLRKLIYGPRGHMNPSVDGWYYERANTNNEEFMELSARNHWLAHQFTQKALYESYESMKLLGERKRKNGTKVPLRAGEIRAIAETVATMNKLLRLSQGLPTEIIDAQSEHTVAVTPQELSGPTDIVLDMNKVAQALLLDPAMNKLVKGAMNENKPKAHGVDHGSEPSADSGRPASGLLEVDGTAGTEQPNGTGTVGGESVAPGPQPERTVGEGPSSPGSHAADEPGPSERTGSGTGCGEPSNEPIEATTVGQPDAPSEPSGLPPGYNRPVEAPGSGGTTNSSPEERTGWAGFAPEFEGF